MNRASALQAMRCPSPLDDNPWRPKMIDCTTGRRTGDSGLPLCGRYLVVCVRSLSLRVRANEADTPHSVVWAIGALADGETEALGTLTPWRQGRPAWTVAAAELRLRGVEQIRVLVTEDAGIQANDFPGKPALVSGLACMPESMSSLGLAARHCRVVERTSLLAERIGAAIRRRLGRMAPLSNAVDAEELVARSLAQAKRRIETSSNISSGARHRPSGLGSPWATTGQRWELPIAARGSAR